MSIIAVLKNKTTFAVGRSMLTMTKHSPELLTAAGVVGVVGSGAMLVSATLKVEPIFEELKGNKEAIAQMREDRPSEYSEEDVKKDTVTVHVKAGMSLVKLYAPAVTTGLVSIGCFVGAHGIMKKRNVALAAAYKSMESAYNNYRRRIVEELGEDQEVEIYKDIQEVEIIDTDEEGAETKTIRKGAKEPSDHSPYARFFDELCDTWSKNPEYNLVFLQAQQAYANNMLKARGHVFLNDVYDGLGMERTSAGSVVGWVLSKDPNADNYIDFGIFSGESESARRFVNGLDDSILLDFNVDGTIFDKI